MASPFAVFRRNQKVLLATAGIGAILLFVVGDPLQRMLTGGSQGPSNPVVVETKYGDYTETDLTALRQARQLVDRFLQSAIQATVDAEIGKGQWDPRSRNRIVESLYGQWQERVMGSRPSNSEAAAIQTIALANEAKELGMVVSDRAINDTLAEMTFDSLSSETLQQIIDGLNGGHRVSAVRLFEALRTELLASNLRILFIRSLSDFPPAQKFEFFLRLNQRAKAEIMPLAVADFASQVANPDKATLEKFFDKYKDRLPDAASPEPGFKEPPRAAFQYFKADFAKFQEEMKPKVTDEEIRDYYEKNKAQFVELDLPDQPSDEPGDETAPDETKPAEGADDAPGDESKEPNEPKAEGESAPQSSDEPAADTPADAKPAEEPKSAEPPQENQSSAESKARIRLVSTAKRAVDESSDAPQEAADQSPAEQEPAPADAAVGTTQPGETPTATEGDAKAAAKEPAAEPSADATDKPADRASEAIDKSAGDAAAAAADADAMPEAKPSEPRYEPLEKVQDQIRQSIASQMAAERISEIFDQIQAQMRTYADDRDIYTTRNDKNVKPPKPLPFAELAKKFGVEAKELPLVTAAEAAGEDLGTVSRIVQDPRSQFGFRSEPFVEFAFSENMPTYRPNVVTDNEGNGYLFWKTEEVASHVPEFAQVHDKVLAAWKLIEARPLARKRADELAAQAKADHKPLKEIFGTTPGLNVIESDSFTWMTGGNVPQNPMGGPVRLSQIDGVEYVDEAFMKTVFGLSVGDIGVATNAPKDTVYVVRLAEFEQPLEQLRDEFAKERSPAYMVVAQPYQREMYLAWIDDQERAAGIHWLREPDQVRERAAAPDPDDLGDL